MNDKEQEHEILMTSLIVGDPEILAEKSRNQLKEFRMIAAREAMTKLSDEELSGLKDLLNRTHTKIRETVAKAHGSVKIQLTMDEWKTYGNVIGRLYMGQLYTTSWDVDSIEGHVVFVVQWMSDLEYCYGSRKETDYVIMAREWAKDEEEKRKKEQYGKEYLTPEEQKKEPQNQL